MHLFFVILISLLATVENILPSIIGFQKTPAGAVFLGTVHHSDDYFYYLSQFAQGATRWITTTNLYTSENVPDTLIGWSNVLTGRLFHLIGISAIPAYQISIAIWTFLLCLTAYQLAFVIFNDKKKALLSLVLFVLYHAFPIMQNNHWTYADYWNNFSVPRVRFGGVPHQLFLNTLSIVTIAFLLQKKPVLMALSSFLLASLQPVLWLLITVSSGIIALFKRHTIFPTIILFVSGILPALYLNTLFKTVPFSQLKMWEALAQAPLSLTHVLLAMGPIFLIALISVSTFMRKQSYSHGVMFVFSVSSLALFLSPFPQMFHLSNVRFMSTLTILCISLIATEGLCAIRSRMLSFSLFLLLVILLIPNHLQTLKLSTNFNPTNAYEYLSKNDVGFLTSIKTIGSPEDTFLVLWPYNSIFPALTGLKSYHGHPLLTIQATEKDARAALFFDGKMTDDHMKQFLIENEITFVIAYPWQTHLNQLSYLGIQQTTQNLVLYKVAIQPLKTYSTSATLIF